MRGINDALSVTHALVFGCTRARDDVDIGTADRGVRVGKKGNVHFFDIRRRRTLWPDARLRHCPFERRYEPFLYLRGELATAFTSFAGHEEESDVHKTVGVSWWGGARIGWAWMSDPGLLLLFSPGVSVAPIFTMTKGGAYRFGVLAHPAVTMGLGRFAFDFGPDTEIVIAKGGPWRREVPVVNMGVRVALGASF